jgi:hypothetical protein
MLKSAYYCERNERKAREWEAYKDLCVGARANHAALRPKQNKFARMMKGPI